MSVEIALAVVTGLLAAVGAAGAVMALAQVGRMELSARAGVALVAGALAAWGIESALHAQAHWWQALLMLLVVATHAVRTMRGRLPALRRR